jgi:hypothetical protein
MQLPPIPTNFLDTMTSGDASPNTPLAMSYFANYVYFFRFVIPVNCILTYAACLVSVGNAGALARIGLYSIWPYGALRGQPARLFFTTGDLDCSVAGWRGAAINAIVPAGVYFIATEVNQTAPLSFTRYIYKGCIPGPTLGSRSLGMYKNLGAYMALPADFAELMTMDTLAGYCPFLSVRVQ